METPSMQRLTLRMTIEHFPLKQPFRIAGHVFTQTSVLLAEVSDGMHRGRGEGNGVYYLGDNAVHMLAEAERVRQAIEAGASRAHLQHLLPPGGARNALDCAYWELEAARAREPVWALAGLDRPRPLRSTQTLGADAPEAMAAIARAIDPEAPLKLKLTGDLLDDIARVGAVRAARPEAWIGVDANQGYAIGILPHLLAALVDNNVALLEQPLQRGREADLDEIDRPLRFAADESALSLVEIAALVGRFDVVNIKLDKCGGLTEGLAIAREARALGLGVMVGNMAGTSLSMAPSYLVGQLCDVVDLDGPTMLTNDRQPGVTYRDGHIHCSDEVWGGGN